MFWVQKAFSVRDVFCSSEGDISVAQCSALLRSGSETMCYIQVIRSCFAQFALMKSTLQRFCNKTVITEMTAVQREVRI